MVQCFLEYSNSFEFSTNIPWLCIGCKFPIRSLEERVGNIEAVLVIVRQYRIMSKVKNDKPTLN